MRTACLASLVALRLFASSSAKAEHTLPRDVRRSDVQPVMLHIEDGDREMRAAMRQARQTEPRFIEALQSPRAGRSHFAVKKPFYQAGHVEHMWLTGVTFSQHRFHGYLDNRPHAIKGVHVGDRFSVNPDEISDWAYIDRGTLQGGYTILAIYRKLPRDQQQQLIHEVDCHLSRR